MPWLLTSPGHQQPWYWLYWICRSFSYLRKDFKYLCHINVDEYTKCKYMCMFTLKNLTRKRLRRSLSQFHIPVVLTTEHSHFLQNQIIICDIGWWLDDSDPIPEQTLHARDKCRTRNRQVDLVAANGVIFYFISFSPNTNHQIDVTGCSRMMWTKIHKYKQCLYYHVEHTKWFLRKSRWMYPLNYFVLIWLWVLNVNVSHKNVWLLEMSSGENSFTYIMIMMRFVCIRRHKLD